MVVALQRLSPPVPALGIVEIVVGAQGLIPVLAAGGIIAGLAHAHGDGFHHILAGCHSTVVDQGAAVSQGQAPVVVGIQLIGDPPQQLPVAVHADSLHGLEEVRAIVHVCFQLGIGGLDIFHGGDDQVAFLQNAQQILQHGLQVGILVDGVIIGIGGDDILVGNILCLQDLVGLADEALGPGLGLAAAGEVVPPVASLYCLRFHRAKWRSLLSRMTVSPSM